MTLTEFLLARITEDEEAASACGCDPADDSPVRWVYDRANSDALRQFKGDEPDGVLVRAWQYRKPVQYGDWTIATHWEEDGEHIARHDPARVLAECKAKRRVVELHGGNEPYHVDPCDAHDAAFATIPCDTIRHLAAVYADHPDYDEGWRP